MQWRRFSGHRTCRDCLSYQPALSYLPPPSHRNHDSLEIREYRLLLRPPPHLIRLASPQKKQKNKKTYESDSASLPKLPLDMIEIIANLLVDKNLRRTCASLDSVCEAFKEVVDPILWKSVVLRWNNAGRGNKGEDKCKTVFESDGARYIQ